MKKRKVAMLLSTFMAFSTIAGCGGSSDSGTGTAPEANKENKTLKIAAFEGGYGKAYWDKLKTDFEANNEGVTVELTIASNLEEVIRPKIQAGDIPDIIYLATSRQEALTETFINEQALHDLSGMLDKEIPGEGVKVKDKISDGFLGNTLTNPYGDDKTYLAPLYYSTTGLFYNKALFEEKGYEVPTTWDEMFELGDKAKADGISLFTYPVAGYFDSAIPAMIAAAGGVDAFDSVMNYEEGSWTTPEVTKVLETIGKMKDYLEPTVVANANGQGFKNNQQLILDNKALFMPNGNWVVGEMEDAPRAEGFEWGLAAYPSFEKGGDAYAFNFLEQMYIPKEAENKELAEEFMAYMYSDKAVDIIAENAKAVVPVKGGMEIAGKHLDDLQKELFGIFDAGAKPVMGGFAATNPIEGLTFKDIYTGTIDSIMNGTKTVEDWQKALDEASNKLRAEIIK
ncbi:MAG: carbohydrate ABC transporter substrate-binding protein [Sarcina sp.]